MKRLFYIIIFAALCTGSFAQRKAPFSKEEFRAKQEAFITQKAQLTAEEAKQFFKLYFELQDKKDQYNHKAWEKMREGWKGNLSEDEYANITETVLQTRIATDELELEYLKKYKKFLSSKKIYDIQQAEMGFHRELLKPRGKR